MNIADKLGELNSAFGWKLQRNSDGDFSITVWTKSQLANEPSCVLSTGWYKNLYKAVEKAIEMFKAHTGECGLC